MADQNRHMAWALGIALLLHVSAYAYWLSLPAPRAGAAAGGLRFALSENVNTRVWQDVAPVTSEAEAPPTTESAVEPEPDVQPKPVVETKPVQPVRELPTRRAKAPANSAPSPAPVAASAATPRSSSDAEIGNHGSNQAASELGAGDAVALANYRALVRERVQRHERYPRAAARRGIEGDGVVTITVTRSGKIIAFSIAQSTGYAILDRELKAWLERAVPLPAFPSEMPQAELEITLQLVFDLDS